MDLDVVGSNPITRPNDRWNPEAAALRARKAEGGIVSGTAICPRIDRAGSDPFGAAGSARGRTGASAP